MRQMIRRQFCEVIAGNKLRLVLRIIRLAVEPLVIPRHDELRRLRITVGTDSKRTADGKCSTIEEDMLDNRSGRRLSIAEIPFELHIVEILRQARAEAIAMQIPIGDEEFAAIIGGEIGG